MDEKTLKRLREIQTEQKKVLKYLQRSQIAMSRNTKKLKLLEREQEILLNPCLPGL